MIVKHRKIDVVAEPEKPITASIKEEPASKIKRKHNKEVPAVSLIEEEEK